MCSSLLSVRFEVQAYLPENMAEDFEDAGQRYAFLLRPVKDLGKNFEVDIAKELDEYCERLSSVTEEAQYGVDNHHRSVVEDVYKWCFGRFVSLGFST